MYIYILYNIYLYDIYFTYFRYKIVCIVQIVEKKNQGVLSVAKLLRDLKKDKYVESKFENTNLMAAVMVGALYYE